MTLLHRGLSSALALLATAGCADHSPSQSAPPAVRPVEPRAKPDAPPPPPSPPPEARPPYVDLEVDGFAPAVVALPQEGAPRHPLVLAAHGNFDRPSWECAYWRRLFPTAFVFCPRGVPRDDAPEGDPRFTYTSAQALGAETAAGLEAMARRFGDEVDTERAVWVGLSRGAYLGAALAPEIGGRFSTMVLVEGGHDPWVGPGAKGFVDAGGKRVLFVCGRAGCVQDARKAAYLLEHHGAHSRVELVPGMGHGLNEDAVAVIEGALPWLLGAVEG